MTMNKMKQIPGKETNHKKTSIKNKVLTFKSSKKIPIILVLSTASTHTLNTDKIEKIT